MRKTEEIGSKDNGNIEISENLLTSPANKIIKLPPRTDLLIADTSNIRYLFQEICIRFTSDNVLQFRLSFPQSSLLYFLASLMAFSGP